MSDEDRYKSILGSDSDDEKDKKKEAPKSSYHSYTTKDDDEDDFFKSDEDTKDNKPNAYKSSYTLYGAGGSVEEENDDDEPLIITQKGDDEAEPYNPALDQNLDESEELDIYTTQTLTNEEEERYKTLFDDDAHPILNIINQTEEKEEKQEEPKQEKPAEEKKHDHHSQKPKEGREEDPIVEMEALLEEKQAEELQKVLGELMKLKEPKQLIVEIAKHNPLLNAIQKLLKIEPTPMINLSWNDKFKKALNEVGEKKYEELTKLGNDFVASATKYGKIIISELYLPYHKKTIKPLSVGGVAGGKKFSADGIFFKLAFDEGGMYQSYNNALKAAGHELKSLISIYNCGVPGINLALMAMIDYRGFRLLCSTTLPLGKDSLIYGSNDAGRTVHADEPVFNEMMEELGKKLNVAAHNVKDAIIYGPGDLEGHRGTDGNYYLLDLARLFPPEYPKNRQNSYKVWFELFRPEFLKQYPVPLCSDTCTSWNSWNLNKKQSTADLKKATLELYSKYIPNCAVTLDEISLTASELRISEIIHREGVNCRHLGRLRNCCMQDKAKRWLLTEMIARVLKIRVNEKLRAEMERLKVSEEEPYKSLLVDELNLVIGKDEKSALFWLKELPRLLVLKFGPQSLTKEEVSGDEDLRTKIYSMELLFELLFEFLSVKLSKKASADLHAALKETPPQFLFIRPDIDRMNARVKHSNLIDHAVSNLLANRGYSLYDSKTGDSESLRMFECAKQKFKEAAASCSTNPVIFKEWADLLIQLALLWQARTARFEEQNPSEDASKTDNFKNCTAHFEEAAQVYKQAIKLDRSLFKLAFDNAQAYVMLTSSQTGAARSLYYAGAYHLLNMLLYYGDSADHLLSLSTASRWCGILGIKVDRKASTDSLYQKSALFLEKALLKNPKLEDEVFKTLEFDCKTLEQKLEMSSLLSIALYSKIVAFKLKTVSKNAKQLNFSECKNLYAYSLETIFQDNQYVSLNLNGCSSVDDYLANLLPGAFVEIELERTKISDKTIEALSKCTSLKKLNVSKCVYLTNKAISLLSENASLQELNISECPNITSNGIELFLKGFPSLQLVDLRKYKKMENQIKIVEKARPALKILHTSIPTFLSDECDESITLKVDENIAIFNGAEAMMVKANAIIPKSAKLFYFEMKVLDKGKNGQVAIGAIESEASLKESMPGWLSGFGYHGDDGCCFTASTEGQGKRYGPIYETGDVVGFGADFENNLVFFTRNGKFAGFAFNNEINTKISYFPVVGSKSKGSSVQANFGTGDERFVFDLTKYSKDLKSEIDPSELPPEEEGSDDEGGDDDDEDEDN